MSSNKTYDVAILGSGLAGTLLGAILAHGGADVLILDPRSHPRAATGESLTPRAAVALRALAERYGVPEIRTLTTFENCSQIISSAFGVRKHYGFLMHREGRRQDPLEVNQSTNGPLSDAPHLYRQDTDAYLFQAALRHGCEARQNYRIGEIDIDGAGVTITGADGSTYRARYVVDTNRSSHLAEKYALREEEPGLRHRSHSQWTHMVSVTPADEVLAGRPAADRPPVPWHQGTVHHIFDGGWMWVIPFDNHPRSRSRLCSVGLTLRGPAEPGVTPEELFTRQLARFPDLERQFEGASPVREWERDDQVQYGAKSLVGDRWALIGEAAGAVDPLFFRGLSNTAEVVGSLAWRLLRAVADDDFSAGRFQFVERLQQALLTCDAELVGSAYTAFSDYPLWNVVFRIWAWGSGAGSFRLQEAMAKFQSDGSDQHFRRLEEAPYLGFLWPDHDGFRKLFDEMVARCQAVEEGGLDSGTAAAELWEMVGDTDFIPRYLGFAEPNARFVNPGPLQIVRSLRWSREHADAELRRLLAGNVRQAVAARVQGRRIF